MFVCLFSPHSSPPSWIVRKGRQNVQRSFRLIVRLSQWPRGALTRSSISSAIRSYPSTAPIISTSTHIFNGRSTSPLATLRSHSSFRNASNQAALLEPDYDGEDYYPHHASGGYHLPDEVFHPHSNLDSLPEFEPRDSDFDHLSPDVVVPDQIDVDRAFVSSDLPSGHDESRAPDEYVDLAEGSTKRRKTKGKGRRRVVEVSDLPALPIGDLPPDGKTRYDWRKRSLTAEKLAAMSRKGFSVDTIKRVHPHNMKEGVGKYDQEIQRYHDQLVFPFINLASSLASSLNDKDHSESKELTGRSLIGLT